MEIVSQLQELISTALRETYDYEIAPADLVLNTTRADQNGDFTLVTFPLARPLKAKPQEIAERIADRLASEQEVIAGTEVVKGFLNIELSDKFWQEQLAYIENTENFGFAPPTGIKTMVEFASPNTNKPLHLGHVRNILLGYSTSEILRAAGQDVIRVQIVNDRGIAICKSMLAWQRFGAGSTPESTQTKGDHFVGDYYVKFEQEFQREYAAWRDSEEGAAVLADVRVKEGEDPAKAFKNTYFNEYSELGGAARKMLQDWEAGDAEVRQLWQKMNGWVYDGFDATYDRLGVSFEKLYYESDTYLLGKDLTEQGLAAGVFYRKEDGSVWIDLSDQKLDHKIILRADGTSVYITQDIGTARQRYDDFGVDRMIYVVADEQNYHFEVLFKTLQKLGEPYADQLYHLSYGMIDLTTGKMKSREGTVVDADELLDEVVAEARASADERAELSDDNEAQRQLAAEQVGQAAIKYYILKVNPRKRMTFDPKESVDLQGNTGPYIQYSFVRANGVVQRAIKEGLDDASSQKYEKLAPAERELIRHMASFPEVIQAAAAELNPAEVAGFAYGLAKRYHKFWHDHSVLSAESDAARAFRIKLSRAVADTLRRSMKLLGIEMPERM